ncbi:MAG: SH3 domain-containing protein [Lachnospiraceae bacterium]|nr:SH3 domain-containing protein [Lachnospiraceae bacterium]
MKVQELKDKTAAFIRKYGRYILAAILFALLVLLMVKFGGEQETAPTTELGSTETEKLESFEVDQVEGLNELIINYFTAYAQGDLATLQNYARSVTENELNFISMFSQYVEGYEDIRCYSKPGLEEGSYLVSVYLKMRFTGVETPAPGLEFFYVRTDENGALYIDNLYSSYNRLNMELETEPEVMALIDTFQNDPEVLALQTEVQAEYEAAVASDEQLAAAVNTTIPEAYAAWAASLAQDGGEGSTDTGESADQTNENAESTDAENPEENTADPEENADQPEETRETVYATANVNVRKEPSADSEALGKVRKGAELTRVAVTEDGWSQVEYEGSLAYIKSEYLSEGGNTDENETDDTGENETGNADVVPEGSKIVLEKTINIRASMSETSAKVGVAYSGDTVEVIMSYEEGWTKVSWKDKTGYIKTELLK